MRKISALILAVMLIFSALAVTSSAATLSPENEFIISVEVSGNIGGRVAPKGGSYKLGDDVTFHFYPDEGYYVKNVWVDGVEIGPVSYYEFKNLSADHEIIVEFASKTDSSQTSTTRIPVKPNKDAVSPDTGSDDIAGIVVAGGVVAAAVVGIALLSKKKEDQE